MDYSRRGRGGRALPWSPTAGRGSGDRETRGPRVEAGSPCPWAPARLGACREAECEGSRAAESSSEGALGACGKRGWVEVPRAEWAERPRLGAVVPGRRAAVVVPRGPGSSSRSRGGGPGMGGERVHPGSSSSPSDPAPASARGGSEARPCCRFLREPRLGEGVVGRGGRLRSRHRPALAPPGAHWRAVGGGARGPSPGGRASGGGGRAQEVGER